MSDNTLPPSAPAPTRPQIKARKARVSLVWLVPIVAGLIGLSMLVHDFLNVGPKVVVSFLTAEGLEAKKTQVKYKNVVIGVVTDIELSEDRTHILATIELNQSATPFTRHEYLVALHDSGSAGELLSPKLQRLRLRFLGPELTTFSGLEPVATETPYPVSYRLGIAATDGFVGHNGILNGFTSELWFDPATGASVAVEPGAAEDPVQQAGGPVVPRRRVPARRTPVLRHGPTSEGR